MKLLKFVARQRTVVVAVVVGALDIVDQLARADHLSWRSILTLIVAAVISRQVVTPYNKPKES